jgi:hypothetical protein
LSDKWKISLTAIPRFNSEAGEAIEDAGQFGGAVITTHKFSDRISLKAGLYYNKEFFGNYFLPLAGVEWNPSDKLYIFGILPNNLVLDYRLNKKLHAGFIYKGITTSFRLAESGFYHYYRMEEGQTGIFFDYYFKKNFVLQIQTGHTLLRNYGYGFLNEDHFLQDLKDASIIKVGLSYRMWLNEK